MGNDRIHVTASRVIAGLALVLGVSLDARAQGQITVSAGATMSAQVAPNGKITIPVGIDVTTAPGSNVASLATSVTWTPTLMSLDSVRPASFGTLTSNIASGSASLAWFNVSGATGALPIANLYFSTTSSVGGTSVRVLPSSAANDAGASVVAQLLPRNVDVCVAPLGSWGDATGDGSVNIIDAQQIGRYTVSLSVANLAALNAMGDVNADATVNIIDAQQIARFSVALSAAPLIGTSILLAPPVSSVLVGPAEQSVGIGRSASLIGTPRDAANTPLLGCAPVAWASTNTAVATVSATGVVTGVTQGSATITATSNGQTGSSAITTFVPVASIAVAPDTVTVSMGASVQLTPIARNDANNVMAGQIFTYASSDESIATVSSSGLVTTRTVGPVTITAASGGVTAGMGIQVAPLATNSLAVGDSHACVLDVTGAAHCWGSNASGQLGDGTTTSRSIPVPVAVNAGLRFTQITASSGSTCAVSSDKRLLCWGTFAGTGNSLTPFPISGSIAVQSTGVITTHGCFLDTLGAAFCGGRNPSGQLGTGDTLSSLVPRPVSGGITFKFLGVGLFGPCGLDTGGSAFCWGNNSFKTLGIAAQPANSLVPAAVSGGLTFTSLNAGAILNCGVVAGGTGYCWGTSYHGAAGTGGTAITTNVTPTAIVSPVVFASVVPGTGNDIFDSICGLATDGTAYCWGNNISGQVGTSETLPGTCTSGAQTFACTGVPTAVTTSSKFTVLGAGAEQACGITTTRTVLCWGRNNAGQLGDNTTVNRSTPVLVLGNLRLP